MLKAFFLLWSCSVLMIPACNDHPKYKDDFYNNDMSDISLRLPLLKPYEALKNGFWTVQFHTSILELAADHIFVDPDRCIAGYGDNGTTVRQGKTVPYTIYFLIDIKNKKELPFYDSVKFVDELKQHGLSWSNLVLTDNVYSNYHETGLLPWQAQP